MIRTVCTLMLLLMPSILPAQMNTIRVGAKHFNEGYILSEMIALLLEDGGFSVERKFNLGGTAVSFEALRNNAIDVYPEYTGTIASEILKYDQRLKIGELNAKLKLLDLEISAPYGFDNTYALLIDSVLSKKHAIRKISDLQHHAYLTLGLSYEFLKRKARSVLRATAAAHSP